MTRFTKLGLTCSVVLFWAFLPQVHAKDEGTSSLVKSHQVIAALQDGNRSFVSGAVKVDLGAERRRSLVPAQHPKAIVLSCADSRVPPEHVFGQGLGDLFVVRTAGNVADRVALGSIEYAVEHLHVPTIVVMGHRRCGAVKAALDSGGKSLGSPNLDAIVERVRPALTGLDGSSGDALFDAAVDANARSSALRLGKDSEILRKAIAEGHVSVVSAVYDLESGAVTFDKLSAPKAEPIPGEAPATAH